MAFLWILVVQLSAFSKSFMYVFRGIKFLSFCGVVCIRAKCLMFFAFLLGLVLGQLDRGTTTTSFPLYNKYFILSSLTCIYAHMHA